MFFSQNSVDQKLVDHVILERVQSPIVRSVFGKNGVMEGKPTLDGTDIVLFFNALLYADLLDGLESPQSTPDYAYASRVLSSLTEKHPQNGAYPFYRTLVLQRLHSSESEQKEWLMKAMQAREYDTHFLTLARQLEYEFQQNSTVWLQGLNFLSRVPIPLMHFKIVNELFPKPTIAEMKIIIEFGLRLNRSPVSSIVERAWGNVLVSRFWRQAYGERPVPKLHDFKVEKAIEDGKSWAELNAIDCNPKPLQDFYERVKRSGLPWMKL